ncbi:CPBP family intramembrane metalloprotease [bacterium]|nr:CPBP family intramembrane metalloprotease [candidate division CSSED10-310 bacterium]
MKHINPCNRFVSGVLICLGIYGLGIWASEWKFIRFHSWIPDSFATHTVFLVCSLSLMIRYSGGNLSRYGFRPVNLRNLIRPVLVLALIFAAANIVLVPVSNLISRLTGSGTPGGQAQGMSAGQIFVFIVIYASVCEEFLFRGFLQNFLALLSPVTLRIFKLKLSLPVVTGAVLFGLGHFIVLSTGAGWGPVIHIVLLTTTIGLVAGHYAERTGSLVTAIVLHMIANIPALISALVGISPGM